MVKTDVGLVKVLLYLLFFLMQPGIVQIVVNTGGSQALVQVLLLINAATLSPITTLLLIADSIQVTLSDGISFPRRVTGTDSADDLAVIKITPPSTGLTTVALADSSQIKVGQTVLAIGSPLGNTQTVTSGIISALNRNVSEGQNQATLPDAIQTDAPINPGNSGGALVDMQVIWLVFQRSMPSTPNLTRQPTVWALPFPQIACSLLLNRSSRMGMSLTPGGPFGVSVTSVDQKAAQRTSWAQLLAL